MPHTQERHVRDDHTSADAAPLPTRRATHNATVVRAPREAVYRAFTDPAALAIWLVPDGMTAELHEFDLCVGGGYTMSLFYPPSTATQGKTAANEDRYTARLVELVPPRRIVETICFET